MRFLVLLLSSLISSAAFACIQLPKNVQLQNSPFPFEEFDLTAYGFGFKTKGDGAKARLDCQADDNKYGWTLTGQDDQTKQDVTYTSEQIGSGAFSYDNNDRSSQIQFLKVRGAAAMLQITSEKNKSKIVLTCTRDANNIQTMKAEVYNAEGQKVGELTSEKLMGTRGLSLDKPDAATIDFNSNKKLSLAMEGCGAGAVKGNSKSGGGFN